VATIRSFIAIELSPEARTKIAQLQSRLKGMSPPHTVRWTVPQNIHLTLHFLGDVAVNDLEEVARAVGAAAAGCPVFSLSLANLGCFPHTRRPRIVWVGVAGETDTLIKFQQTLGEQLHERIGFQPESRPYSPHLTIGRVKNGIPQRQLDQLGQILEQEIPQVGQLVELPVTEIQLIQSDLKANGPVYTPLVQGKLPEVH
jgi:RNA 2',3'-cyclic 3'-phosphodiesterase